MQVQHGQQCSRERIPLTSGGVFDFDAVIADCKIVAVISTSGFRTASGKSSSGKMHKIRSDIYFLLLTKAEHKLVLLTEQDMYAQWKKRLRRAEFRVPLS